jgi:hypothetical protein
VIPRALIGPVVAMARPSRPFAEVAAVLSACEAVRRELGPKSIPTLTAEVARRVVDELLHYIEADQGDELIAALNAVKREMLPSAISTLATCPCIDTAADFVDRRVQRLQARSGRYLSVAEQQREKSIIAAELRSLLSARYSRHLRA